MIHFYIGETYYQKTLGNGRDRGFPVPKANKSLCGKIRKGEYSTGTRAGFLQEPRACPVCKAKLEAIDASKKK